LGRNGCIYSIIVIIAIILIIVVIIAIVIVIVIMIGMLSIIVIIIIIVVVIIIISIIFMTMMGNGVYLFDGGDLSKSLFRLVLVALHEGVDIPLHSFAHAFVAALRPALQNNNHNNNPPQLTTSTFVTLLLLFKPSAIKRPPASVKSLPLCITRRHTHAPPAPSIKSQSHPHFKHTCAMSRPPSSHAPAYQVDVLQALEPAEACAQRLNVVIFQLWLLQRVA
jgi:hypothetical protein